MQLNKQLILLPLLMCILHISSFAQSWNKKTNYPVAGGGNGAVAFELNGKIYVGGGLASRQFWQYDPSGGNWTRKADLAGVTTERALALGFSANGKGYVGFGVDGNIKKFDLWEYNPTTDTWTRKQDYHGQTNDGLFCFVINNKAYIGGGEDALTMAMSNSVYEYNPATDDWTQKQNFPTTGIVFPFSFAVNGKGYVSCGQENGVGVKTWQYDPVANSWTARTDYPGDARLGGVSYVVNGKAYCGLGFSSTGFYKNIYSYNASANSWTPETDYPDTARGFAVAAAMGGAAFVGLGWQQPSTLFKSWWQFGTPTAVGFVESPGLTLGCYPNPTHNTLYLTGTITAGANISIYDNAGRLVKEPTTGKQKDIDISTLPAGAYMLSHTEDGMKESVKFVKE